MKIGIDYYIENGYKVFTKTFLSKKGMCCQNGCRHCPWDYRYKNKNYKNMHTGKEHVFVDMDGVLCDFEAKVTALTGFTESHPKWQETKDRLSAEEGFYRDLPPIFGAIEAFRKLCEHYEVYILSTPSWDNPSSYADKRIWAETYLGSVAYKKLILTHNKGLMVGRALIDDRIKNGVANFKGEHIHFGTEKFPNWDAVIKYLIS